MRFPIAVWLLSRIATFCAIGVASPHGIAPIGNWDGAWYGSIAAHGYEFARDGSQHNVAFFPLFPMLASLLLRIGIPWPLAGALIANAAFLGAVLVAYIYAKKRFDERIARWCVVALCLSPLSLFAGVAYSEGLFLFFVSVALLAYDDERFLLAGLATAAASATRPLGVALAVALVAGALVERRSPFAVLKCATGFAGIALFALFCERRFGDALAFVHAQVAWRHSTSIDPDAWAGLLRGAAGGRVHDWIAIAMLAAVIAGLTVYRKRLGAVNAIFLLGALAALAWAGTPLSADRNLYAVLPVSIVLALLFERAPAIGYAAGALGCAGLIFDAMAFARFQWVA